MINAITPINLELIERPSLRYNHFFLSEFQEDMQRYFRVRAAAGPLVPLYVPIGNNGTRLVERIRQPLLLPAPGLLDIFFPKPAPQQDNLQPIINNYPVPFPNRNDHQMIYSVGQNGMLIHLSFGVMGAFVENNRERNFNVTAEGDPHFIGFLASQFPPRIA